MKSNKCNLAVDAGRLQPISCASGPGQLQRIISDNSDLQGALFSFTDKPPENKYLARSKFYPAEQVRRAEISDALLLAGYDREAARFARCRRHVIPVICPDEHRRFGLIETCKSRICPECARIEALKFRRAVKRNIRSWRRSKGQALMFLTLTIRSTGKPQTALEVRRTFRQVRKLVNRFYPKKQNCGAIGVVEFGKAWNLHVHLVVAGPYVSQGALSEEWHRLTGDSFIVDIRLVRKPSYAVNYVLKYLGKVPELNDPDAYLDIIRAFKGARRLHTFGIFYNSVRIRRANHRLECPFCGARLKYYENEANYTHYPSFSWWSRKARDPDISKHDWGMFQSQVGFGGIYGHWAAEAINQVFPGAYFFVDNDKLID